MKIKYILIMILFTVFIIALGGSRASRAESRLYGIDMNGDGMISMEEWQGNQRTFEERDLNGDGFLSGTELSSGMIRPLSSLITFPPVTHCEYYSGTDSAGNIIQQKRCTTSVQQNF